MQAGCQLVQAGHANVWDYPWEYFLVAMDELAKK
jgi:hypothetical protein